MPSRLEVFQQKVGASYAAAVQALLEDGPLQGTTVELEAVEGRPPKTVDLPDGKGSVCRYCLAEWTQEGMTAAYTFSTSSSSPFAAVLSVVGYPTPRDALEAVGLQE